MKIVSVSTFVASIPQDCRRLLYWALLMLLAEIVLAIGVSPDTRTVVPVLVLALVLLANGYLVYCISRVRWPTKLFALLLFLPTVSILREIWALSQRL
jgi:hypothetical protein